MKPKGRILIRKANVKDADILKNLWLKLAKEMFETEKYIVPSVENAEAWLSFTLKGAQEGRATVLLAQTNEEPVGFIHFTYPKNEKLQTSLKFVTIHEIYVKPPHRRSGIATRLLKEALEKAREKGFTNVKLSALSSNVEAIQFYEKSGFRVYRYGMLKKLR